MHQLMKDECQHNPTSGVTLDVTCSQVPPTDVTRAQCLDFMDLHIRCDSGCDDCSQVPPTDVTRAQCLDFMDLHIRCDSGCDVLSSSPY